MSVDAAPSSRVEDARFEALAEYQQNDVLDLIPSLPPRFGGDESAARLWRPGAGGSIANHPR